MAEFWSNHFDTGLDVFSGGRVGLWSSLEFDPNTDYPAIAYFDYTRQRPGYSYFDGVAWRSLLQTTGDWQTVELPLSGFEAVFRGRSVPAAGPVIASRSTLARPRVECFSSRVAMYDGHIVPSSVLRQAPSPLHMSTAPPMPP